MTVCCSGDKSGETSLSLEASTSEAIHAEWDTGESAEEQAAADMQPEAGTPCDIAMRNSAFEAPTALEKYGRCSLTSDGEAKVMVLVLSACQNRGRRDDVR